MGPEKKESEANRTQEEKGESKKLRALGGERVMIVVVSENKLAQKKEVPHNFRVLKKALEERGSALKWGKEGNKLA